MPHALNGPLSAADQEAFDAATASRHRRQRRALRRAELGDKVRDCVI
jgi:hypothetical protein